jgi:polysaccharide biosynthesis/export protein
MKTAFLQLLVLLVITGCRTGPAFDPRGTDTQTFEAVTLSNRFDASLLRAPTEPYRLGPGDAIEVETLGDAAGRSTLNVGPDGKVYYSLLPGLSVWGLSIPEARALLQQQMTNYTRSAPEFVINLRSAASQRVWLLGAVQNPGVYTLTTPTTLLDALAGSGGVLSARLDDAADLSRSFVLRDGKMLTVDFEALLKRGDMGQNLYLKPGDFVFLRPAEKQSVYVLGAVNGPQVLPYSQELTLATAILRAGGTLKFAQNHRVALVRGSLTQPKIAQVSYLEIVKGRATDVPLKPGDIVYVPFVPYRFVAELAEGMLDQLVRTIAVNEGSAVAGGGAAVLQAPAAPIIFPQASPRP